jgi:hypothetical protein
MLITQICSNLDECAATKGNRWMSIPKEVPVRTIILVAVGLAAVSIASTHARADGAWCARDTRGATNCGFHTFAQCQADIRGIGGSCSPNPAFQAYNAGYPTARRGVPAWQY